MRIRGLASVVGLAALAIGTLLAASASAVESRAAERVARADFNGDGYGDLVIGVPSERVDGQIQAGAVHVLYGGPGGLTTTGDQFFTQSSPGVSGVPQQRDFFGQALASGDFDDDGFADLAVGVPFEDVSGNVDEGIVEVLHGSSGGLVPRTSFSYASGTDQGHRCRCRFGFALAVGDFDGTGGDDLAIGVPMLDGPPGADVGGAILLFGRQGAGLEAIGRPLVRPRDFRRTEEWGSVLAAGDYDGDGVDELAMGAPARRAASGAVSVIAGSRGRRYAEKWHFTQRYKDAIFGELNATFGIEGTWGESGDRLGASLVFGDFDGDGRDELAMGIPGDNDAGKDDAGAIVVARSSPPLTRVYTQSDLEGTAAQAGDRFGHALAVADFNGDGRDDLAVSSPLEDVAGRENAGMVQVLRGAAVLVATANAQVWHQGRPGVTGALEAGDTFGLTLAARDLDGDGRAELAVGVPNEDVESTPDAGAVTLLRGGSFGLTGTGSSTWTQSSPGIADARSSHDKFGSSLR